MTLPTPGVTPANWGAQLNAEVEAAGAPLAIVRYAPAVTAAPATTSATAVDVDATNLSVTFTVPTSGKVRVMLNAWVVPTASTTYHWALREGSSVVAGSPSGVFYNDTIQLRQTALIWIDGLTPGDVKTWKWAHYLSFGTGSSGISAGTDNPALMEVLKG